MKEDGIFKVSFSNGETIHVRANGSDHALRIGNSLAETLYTHVGSAVIASEIIIASEIVKQEGESKM